MSYISWGQKMATVSAIGRQKDETSYTEIWLNEKCFMEKSKRVTPLVDAECHIRSKMDKKGFEKIYISSSIGYGIFAKRDFSKSEFLLEYDGKYIDPDLADQQSDQTFLYYFSKGGKDYCIDGTACNSLGKFINDCPKKYANCIPKVILIDSEPHVVFFALKQISAGTELRYDYGGDSPWRKMPHASLQPVVLPRQTAEQRCPATGSDPVAANYNLEPTNTSDRDYCQHEVSTTILTEASSGETTAERDNCRFDAPSQAVEIKGNQETSKNPQETCLFEAVVAAAGEDSNQEATSAREVRRLEMSTLISIEASSGDTSAERDDCRLDVPIPEVEVEGSQETSNNPRDTADSNQEATSSREECQLKVSTSIAKEANSGETTAERNDCQLDAPIPAEKVEDSQETSKNPRDAAAADNNQEATSTTEEYLLEVSTSIAVEAISGKTTAEREDRQLGAPSPAVEVADSFSQDDNYADDCTLKISSPAEEVEGYRVTSENPRDTVAADSSPEATSAREEWILEVSTSIATEASSGETTAEREDCQLDAPSPAVEVADSFKEDNTEQDDCRLGVPGPAVEIEDIFTDVDTDGEDCRLKISTPTVEVKGYRETSKNPRDTVAADSSHEATSSREECQLEVSTSIAKQASNGETTAERNDCQLDAPIPAVEVEGSQETSKNPLDTAGADNNPQATSAREECRLKVSTSIAKEANSGETTAERNDCQLDAPIPAEKVEDSQETSKNALDTAGADNNPEATSDTEECRLEVSTLIAIEACIGENTAARDDCRLDAPIPAVEVGGSQETSKNPRDAAAADNSQEATSTTEECLLEVSTSIAVEAISGKTTAEREDRQLGVPGPAVEIEDSFTDVDTDGEDCRLKISTPTVEVEGYRETSKNPRDTVAADSSHEATSSREECQLEVSTSIAKQASNGETTAERNDCQLDAPIPAVEVEGSQETSKNSLDTAGADNNPQATSAREECRLEVSTSIAIESSTGETTIESDDSRLGAPSPAVQVEDSFTEVHTDGENCRLKISSQSVEVESCRETSKNPVDIAAADNNLEATSAREECRLEVSNPTVEVEDNKETSKSLQHLEATNRTAPEDWIHDEASIASEGCRQLGTVCTADGNIYDECLDSTQDCSSVDAVATSADSNAMFSSSEEQELFNSGNSSNQSDQSPSVAVPPNFTGVLNIQSEESTELHLSPKKLVCRKPDNEAIRRTKPSYIECGKTSTYVYSTVGKRHSSIGDTNSSKRHRSSNCTESIGTGSTSYRVVDENDRGICRTSSKYSESREISKKNYQFGSKENRERHQSASGCSDSTTTSNKVCHTDDRYDREESQSVSRCNELRQFRRKHDQYGSKNGRERHRSASNYDRSRKIIQEHYLLSKKSDRVRQSKSVSSCSDLRAAKQRRCVTDRAVIHKNSALHSSQLRNSSFEHGVLKASNFRHMNKRQRRQDSSSRDHDNHVPINRKRKANENIAYDKCGKEKSHRSQYVQRKQNSTDSSSSFDESSSDESSAFQDMQSSEVTVATVKYSENGKRLRNKKLQCFVCGAEVLWLSRHFERQHGEHFLVAQVLARTGDRRKNGLKRLKNLGSFKHNVDVLKRGVGELLVIRRPRGEHRAADYVPCSRCYGFYYQYELWRHVCPCDTKSSVEDCEGKSSLLDEARSLLEGAVQGDNFFDEHLNKHVIKHMRTDELLKVVKSDRLILQFGSSQLKRIGVKGSRRIATRMRHLARLLQSLRRTLGKSDGLSEFLSGTYYDAVVESVEELAGLHEDEQGQRAFNRPSLTLLVGNLLIKCCQMKKGNAIRNDDEVSMVQVDRFMSLYASDWSNCMSCPSLATLKTKNYNKPVELPSTSDLMKLKSYTEEKLKQYSAKLEEHPEYKYWRILAEVVLTRLVVFNKRRASEPARLELSQYLSRPNWVKESNKELIENLQPVEKKLMERMDLIQVPGKRNRKVPILVTPDVSIAMQLLVKTRSRCDVPSSNKYFFATDSPNGFFNTWLVLHNHAVAAKVQKPRLITSCRLRKYVATLAQLVDMTNGEREWLAEHLGHTLGVHNSCYRMQEPVIEMAQLSRLLMAIEDGKASEFVGKKLSEINPRGAVYDENMDDNNCDVEPDNECDDEELDAEMQRQIGFPVRSHGDKIQSSPNPGNCIASSSPDVLDNNEVIQKRVKKYRRIIVDSDDGYSGNETDDCTTANVTARSQDGRANRVTTGSSERESEVTITTQSPAKKRKAGERRAWGKDELNALHKAFKNHGRPPTFGEIEAVQAVCLKLKSRTLAQIKTRAWALIQKIKQTD